MHPVAYIVCIICGVCSCLMQAYGSSSDIIQQHPYFVSIQSNGRHVCTGTIVDDYYVITTNSSVGGYPPDSLQVRAGTFRKGRRGWLVQVVRIVPYTSGSQPNSPADDFAMLQVAYPFQYTDKIMWLNPNIDGIEENQSGLIVLWQGYQLTSATVKVLTSAACSAAYQGVLDIVDNMFCVVADGFDSKPWLADLGAPMYDNEQLFGVVTHVPAKTDDKPIIVSEIGSKTSYFLTTVADFAMVFPV